MNAGDRETPKTQPKAETGMFGGVTESRTPPQSPMQSHQAAPRRLLLASLWNSTDSPGKVTLPALQLTEGRLLDSAWLFPHSSLVGS